MPMLLRALAFASGIAGLGYELVWTRMFATVLGQEMLAVLGVVAAFFGGLAAGGVLLDGAIRRSRRPLFIYAALEAVIGLWAVASVWLVPAIGRELPALLGPAPAAAILWGVAFLVPLLVLLPATMAMGGTLTALEVAASRHARDTRAVAGLYGSNTAGAVLGAVGSIFAVAPLLGYSGTLLAMAGVNALCLVAALGAGRYLGPAMVQAFGAMWIPRRLQAALLATGLCGVAIEAVMVRVASQFLQDTVFTFACLLAAYLLGTAAGGSAWAAAQRRGVAVALRAVLPVAVAVGCLGSIAAIPLLPRITGGLAGRSGLLTEIVVALVLFFPPTLAMGALFAALAQEVRDCRGSIGHALGLNAIGAALGPPVAALVLIPALGSVPALVLLALAYLLLLPGDTNRRVWPAASLPVIGALGLLLARPAAVQLPEGTRLLALREGPTTTASVVEGGDGTRYLEVNGHFRMGGTSSRMSDWRQAQVPLVLHPAPRRALFLGVGTGATLAGAARFPGVGAEGVELAPEVRDLLAYFVDRTDPGERTGAPITLADARRFVRASPQRWDVIVADLFHPALDGSGALYTREHFAAVRARLAEGGVFWQWLPLHQLDLPSLRTIIRTFLAVYPQGGAWLAHYGLPTPLLALVGGAGAQRVDPVRLADRLGDPAIAQALRPAGLERAFDVLGLYVGDADALAGFADSGPLNTDDHPVVTFDALRNVRVLAAPSAERLLSVLQEVRPSLRSVLTDPVTADPAEAARRQRLVAYWRARDRFLVLGGGLGPGLQGRALLEAAAPGLLDIVRISPDFDPAYRPLLAMSRELLDHDRGAGTRLLVELATAGPGRPEARLLLEDLSR
ncbi:spermine/spermidine synthase domain-containing protein [Rhodovastum atsumiense]|nr:spermidine synthase [Rhodovastum atsumiense]